MICRKVKQVSIKWIDGKPGWRKRNEKLIIPSKLNEGDMVILENVDYIHRTPMTILPTGAWMEIDCDGPEIKILEPGVS